MNQIVELRYDLVESLEAQVFWVHWIEASSEQQVGVQTRSAACVDAFSHANKNMMLLLANVLMLIDQVALHNAILCYATW